MKRLAILLVISLAGCAVAPQQARQHAALADFPAVFASLYEIKVTVHLEPIIAASPLAGLRPVIDSDGRGTGVAVGNGYILTCRHVIDANTCALTVYNRLETFAASQELTIDVPLHATVTYTATSSSGQQYVGRYGIVMESAANLPGMSGVRVRIDETPTSDSTLQIVGRDTGFDLALLMVVDSRASMSDLPLAAVCATSGSRSNVMLTMESVYAFRHHGYDQALAAPLIDFERGRVVSQAKQPWADYSVQLDMRCGYGYSGGPVVNQYEQIVGITERARFNLEGNPVGPSYMVPGWAVYNFLAESLGQTNVVVEQGH